MSKKSLHIIPVVAILAKRIIFKDMLKKGDGTEFIVELIEFDVDIPEYTFPKAVLRK